MSISNAPFAAVLGFGVEMMKFMDREFHAVIFKLAAGIALLLATENAIFANFLRWWRFLICVAERGVRH